MILSPLNICQMKDYNIEWKRVQTIFFSMIQILL